MTDWTNEFLGTLFPAVPMPFDDEGNPEFGALEQFAAWMRTQPVDGVAVWTRTARASRISREHRLEILSLWLDALEGLRFIAEITPPPDTDTESIAKKALEIAGDAADKVDYLLVSTPTALHDETSRDEKILDYHRAIAEIGIPLIVSCSLQSAGGITYSDDVLSSLLDMPEVAAIRTDLQDQPVAMQDLITRVRMGWPLKAILSGENRMHGYSLYRGCHGLLATIGSICPRLQRELIDAWFMGDSMKFLNLSRLTDHIAEAVFIEPREGVLQRILTGLAHQGIIPESAVNDPWAPPIAPKEEELVRATLDELGEWSDARSS